MSGNDDHLSLPTRHGVRCRSRIKTAEIYLRDIFFVTCFAFKSPFLEGKSKIHSNTLRLSRMSNLTTYCTRKGPQVMGSGTLMCSRAVFQIEIIFFAGLVFIRSMNPRNLFSQLKHLCQFSSGWFVASDIPLQEHQNC